MLVECLEEQIHPVVVCHSENIFDAPSSRYFIFDDDDARAKNNNYFFISRYT